MKMIRFLTAILLIICILVFCRNRYSAPNIRHKLFNYSVSAETEYSAKSTFGRSLNSVGVEEKNKGSLDMNISNFVDRNVVTILNVVTLSKKKIETMWSKYKSNFQKFTGDSEKGSKK